MSFSEPVESTSNIYDLPAAIRAWGGTWSVAALIFVASAMLAWGQGYPTTNYPAPAPPSQPTQPETSMYGANPQAGPPTQPGPVVNGNNVPPAQRTYGQTSQPATTEFASLPTGEQAYRPVLLGLRQFEPTEVLAMVGDQPILACDIMPSIDRFFSRYEGQVPLEQLASEREKAIRAVLSQEVERKLAYVYFMRQVPEEALPQMEDRIYTGFNEQRLPALMEQFEVETPAALDAILREGGSSMSQQRRMFKEHVIAGEAMRSASSGERMVNHEEMLSYYHDHLDEFSFKAKVRWEQIMVNTNNYPNKAEAFRALANMGNEVLRGAPFEAIARRSSEGIRKEQGGQWDWTTQGSLAWVTVDDALFSLPVGRLSPILEDQQSFHIVRVIERSEAGHTPFREAQAEIHEKILEDYRQEKVAEFLEQLEESTIVWTILDDLPEESQESMATGPSADSR